MQVCFSFAGYNLYKAGEEMISSGRLVCIEASAQAHACALADKGLYVFPAQESKRIASLAK